MKQRISKEEIIEKCPRCGGQEWSVPEWICDKCKWQDPTVSHLKGTTAYTSSKIPNKEGVYMCKINHKKGEYPCKKCQKVPLSPSDKTWEEKFDMEFNLHDERCQCYFPTIPAEKVKYEDPECPHVKHKAWFISEIDSATIKAKEEQDRKHNEVYIWLLGYDNFPMKPEGGPTYWWRSHLREKLKSLGINLEEPKS